MDSYLGIEFGSTRIKAVKINSDYIPTASGEYTWSSKFENDIWTYDISEVWQGLKTALSKIGDCSDVKSVGISGMMHGYLAFDKNWNLLTPFRTWQNTITAESAEKLTELFEFNIPQRWSIAHLYQAILNTETHIKNVAHITTLAGYIHYMLTGVNTVGIGEASGMFPIDNNSLDYDADMLKKFNTLISELNISWNIEDVLPKLAIAGETAGKLTKSGALLTDNLIALGTPFAPPEGDAGTGMVATNSVAVKTGNISAGTSIFSMVVMENNLSKVYPEIDIVTTPAGKPVAMVHCNNCTNDCNAWVNMFKEVSNLFGAEPSANELYTKLYTKSLEGDVDCSDILVCNYLAGEGITHFDSGIPLILRKPTSTFTLANFFRATLYSTMATLKLGMDILAEENVKIESLTGHGGLFKTKGVCQKYMASACNAPITCMETASEGGPYGMAILAAFLFRKGESLEQFLNNVVFKNAQSITISPDKKTSDGFNKYIQEYKKMLAIEEKAIEVL